MTEPAESLVERWQQLERVVHEQVPFADTWLLAAVLLVADRLDLIHQETFEIRRML